MAQQTQQPSLLPPHYYCCSNSRAIFAKQIHLPLQFMRETQLTANVVEADLHQRIVAAFKLPGSFPVHPLWACPRHCTFCTQYPAFTAARCAITFETHLSLNTPDGSAPSFPDQLCPLQVSLAFCNWPFYLGAPAVQPYQALAKRFSLGELDRTGHRP